jgi:hypothetical protein
MWPSLMTFALGQNKQLLTNAKTASLLTDVVWNKERKFDSDSELTRLSGYIDRTPLAKRYRIVSSAPDIILKFHEDVLFIGAEKISLTAFDPEDNKVIWTEERPMVDAQNDVSKLVSHFLNAVDGEKSDLARAQEAAAAQAERERAAAQAQREAAGAQAERERAEATAIKWKRVGSGSEIKVWIKDGHLYESSEHRNGNIISSIYCDTVRGGISGIGPSGAYTGTCTYRARWVKDNTNYTSGYEVTASCTVTTAEVITFVTATRIEGWSQRVDSSTLSHTPPTCPVASSDGKEFAYEK